MKQLTKGSIWAKQAFTKGSRPSIDKIVAWIESGNVPGKVIDGVPYVYDDQFDLGVEASNDGTVTPADLVLG